MTLWKPYKAVVKRADEVIYKDVNEEDESKAETATKRTKIKLKFNSLESIIKAEIEGLSSAVRDTTIWFRGIES